MYDHNNPIGEVYLKESRLFLIVFLCGFCWQCAVPPSGTRFGFSILPQELFVDSADTFEITIYIENNSGKTFWIGRSVGTASTRGLPYQSFFPRVRPEGSADFLPQSLTFVDLFDYEERSEDWALANHLIEVLQPKEIFRHTVRINVSELLQEATGSIGPGKYDLMFICQPANAPGDDSYRENKLPEVLTSNTISLIVQ